MNEVAEYGIFMQMQEIATLDELQRCCGDDALLMWAAQGMPGNVERWRRVRAWRRGDAVAVATPYLSCRDRLAIHGPARQVAALVRDVLAETGPRYRPIGSSALVHAVAGDLANLAVAGTFGWMETDRPVVRPGRREVGAPWLDDTWSAPVAELLAEAYPSSYARPGLRGVRRWAGVAGPDGALAAVAADAWPAPSVGYVAGVAARLGLRGNGYGGAVFAFVVDTLVAEHGRAALMVNAANTAAVGLYRRAGLRWRELAAAHVVPGAEPPGPRRELADLADVTS